MKLVAILALVVALGFVAWKRGMIAQSIPQIPPPPPPPPAILNEPAPVISEEEMAKVLKSAQDPEASVRWEAILFLDKVKSPQAMPLMQEMLRLDMEPSLRIKIIELLSTRRGDNVMESLVGSMKDQEADVRLAALRALEKIGDFSVASAITEGPLRDQDEQVRLQAMRTLNSLQDKKQIEIDAARQRYEAQKAAVVQPKK
jgi:HEAT repeat protein